MYSTQMIILIIISCTRDISGIFIPKSSGSSRPSIIITREFSISLPLSLSLSSTSLSLPSSISYNKKHQELTMIIANKCFFSKISNFYLSRKSQNQNAKDKIQKTKYRKCTQQHIIHKISLNVFYHSCRYNTAGKDHNVQINKHFNIFVFQRIQNKQQQKFHVLCVLDFNAK